MAEEWTGGPLDPSMWVRYDTPGSLKEYAETLMQTLRTVKQTQCRLELHGKVLILRNGEEFYAIGMIDG